ncbi:SprB-like repeat protein [Algoriphagus boseongensis]|uniref:SprB-like repeat protein n=1 Tax=Algoriphagus boseongensis TaxID=1442587 RepID=A0A4R6TAF4_9BACT|nr:PKD domain-containing protein [Algoriphagus boseongensis]TDQ19183.1 SprB-like repeat protein [Algoriphagus boseongensis]
MAQSTIGRDFIVGFMENNQKPTQPDKAVIVITANEDASGTFSFQGQVETFSLTKGQIFKKEFLSTTNDIIHRNSDAIENKSVFINSSGDLAVYAYNTRQNSTDATVILPVSNLGKEYFVTAHFSPIIAGPDNSSSTALIIANENGTEVEITPAVTTESGKAAKAPYTITLNAGESYQIKALGDLTGTRVRVVNSTPGDCKKLAVFGGNKMTTVADCGKTGDHMFNQSFPVEYWGKSYIHIPLKNRTSGEIVKVLAGTDNTSVLVNGVNRGTINQGEFLTLDFAVNEVATIETSNPSAVSLLSKSQDCNTSPGLIGDPFLLTYQSNEQRIQNIEFYSVDESGFLFNNANIIAPTSSLSQIRLNGGSITSQFKPVPGNPSFSYAQVNLNDGYNSFTSEEGAIIYVYGAGQRSSYGYSAGFSVPSTELVIQDDQGEEIGSNSVFCLGEENVWEISSSLSQFENFTWDFGDGSTPKSGKTVTHAFDKAGNFTVKITASTGTGNCAVQETKEFEVEVEEIVAEVVGPLSACPGAEVTYFLKNEEVPVPGNWLEISGGQILDQKDDQITIRWLEGFEIGKIIVAPKSSSGCLGEEITLEIEIGKGESLPKPIGQSTLCGPILESYFYEAQIEKNSQISWTVVGGEIISGDGSSKVEVLWKIDSQNWEISFQANNVEGDCGLSSQVLKLERSEPIVIKPFEILTPLCPGEDSGSAEVKIEGGSGNYEIQWSHDPQAKTSKVDGLAAGKYTVTVKDKDGCGSAQLEVEVKNPPGMRLLSEIETKPETCEGTNSGSFRVKVGGGVPPYTIEGLESSWDGQFLNVSGLSKGPFNLFVLDSKGCSLSIQGQIGAITPMTLTFVEENQGCSGGNTGSLAVEVLGGVPPYKYEWSFDGGVAIASTSTSTSTRSVSSGKRISSMPSGGYYVQITDANGCTVRGLGMISDAKPIVRMPTGFMPKDGSYEPVSNCSVLFDMKVFDRWGNLIYSGTEGWDGELKGQEAPIGTYSYRLVYYYPMNGEELFEEIQGVFTLIK